MASYCLRPTFLRPISSDSGGCGSPGQIKNHAPRPTSNMSETKPAMSPKKIQTQHLSRGG
jgi:uncharacterized protein YgiB involved in biofilm formation